MGFFVLDSRLSRVGRICSVVDFFLFHVFYTVGPGWEGRMEVLLENMPHLVPCEEMLKGWFEPRDGEERLWEKMDGSGGGEFLGISWFLLIKRGLC